MPAHNGSPEALWKLGGDLQPCPALHLVEHACRPRFARVSSCALLLIPGPLLTRGGAHVGLRARRDDRLGLRRRKHLRVAAEALELGRREPLGLPATSTAPCRHDGHSVTITCAAGPAELPSPPSMNAPTSAVTKASSSMPWPVRRRYSSCALRNSARVLPSSSKRTTRRRALSSTGASGMSPSRRPETRRSTSRTDRPRHAIADEPAACHDHTCSSPPLEGPGGWLPLEPGCVHRLLRGASSLSLSGRPAARARRAWMRLWPWMRHVWPSCPDAGVSREPAEASIFTCFQPSLSPVVCDGNSDVECWQLARRMGAGLTDPIALCVQNGGCVSADFCANYDDASSCRCGRGPACGVGYVCARRSPCDPLECWPCRAND